MHMFPTLQSLPNPDFAALLMEKMCAMWHLADHVLRENGIETNRTVFSYVGLDLGEVENGDVAVGVRTKYTLLALQPRCRERTLGFEIPASFLFPFPVPCYPRYRSAMLPHQ